MKPLRKYPLALAAFLATFFIIPLSVLGDDDFDDIYYNPSKEKKTTPAPQQPSVSSVPGADTYVVPATGGIPMSVDEYNRRGFFAVADSVAADSLPQHEKIARMYYPEDDVSASGSGGSDVTVNLYNYGYGGGSYYTPWYADNVYSFYAPYSSWWGPSFSISWGWPGYWPSYYPGYWPGYYPGYWPPFAPGYWPGTRPVPNVRPNYRHPGASPSYGGNMRPNRPGGVRPGNGSMRPPSGSVARPGVSNTGNNGNSVARPSGGNLNPGSTRPSVNGSVARPSNNATISTRPENNNTNMRPVPSVNTNTSRPSYSQPSAPRHSGAGGRGGSSGGGRGRH